jgi:molybdenum cofactor synthesis domain-containing protein
VAERVVELVAKVLTVSDSVHAGTRSDGSGPAVRSYLIDHGFSVPVLEVAPDGVTPVSNAIRRLAGDFFGLLVTNGGTGFSPTDSTPEATRAVVERLAPGLAEAMRAAGPLGPLSRGVAGTLGTCLIVNVPGSTKGALESIGSIIDVLPHALELLGGGHPH